MDATLHDCMRNVNTWSGWLYPYSITHVYLRVYAKYRSHYYNLLANSLLVAYTFPNKTCKLLQLRYIARTRLIHEVLHIIHTYLLHREVIKLDREEQNFGRSTRTFVVGRLQVEILFTNAEGLQNHDAGLHFAGSGALCKRTTLHGKIYNSACKSVSGWPFCYFVITVYLVVKLQKYSVKTELSTFTRTILTSTICASLAVNPMPICRRRMHAWIEEPMRWSPDGLQQFIQPTNVFQ